jgi:hypothetical protein
MLTNIFFLQKITGDLLHKKTNIKYLKFLNIIIIDLQI